MIDIREHGIGVNGLKASDKQALIDITNTGIANSDSIKTNLINALNSKLGTGLTTDKGWIYIVNTINGSNVKRWASGSGTFNTASISGLSFTPSTVILSISGKDRSSGFDIVQLLVKSSIIGLYSRYPEPTFVSDGVYALRNTQGGLYNESNGENKITFTNNGFTFFAGNYIETTKYNWIAFE